MLLLCTLVMDYIDHHCVSGLIPKKAPFPTVKCTHLSLVRRLTFVTGGISSILPMVQLGVYTQSSGSLMGNRHWLGSIFRGAYMEQPINN